MITRKRFISWTAILSIVCLVVVAPVPVADLVASPAVAMAQCDPPGANVKCWTGAIDNKWSQDGNWDPPGAPQETDSVYHLTGDAIQMDGAVAEIKSFRFDSSGSLSIDPDARMIVTFDFTAITGESPYPLTVGAGAELDIGWDMTWVDVTLAQGTAQNRTEVTVGNTIGPSNWSIEPFAFLGANFGGINLTEFPENTWTIQGRLAMNPGLILGAGTWIVDGTGPETATMTFGAGPFKFDDSTLIRGYMTGSDFADAEIAQSLLVDA